VINTVNYFILVNVNPRLPGSAVCNWLFVIGCLLVPLLGSLPIQQGTDS